MPSLTLARTGQISEPQECGPGTRITTTGSGYVEWTSGTLADVRNGVATWQRWPGGSAGDYCDTLRRLVFRGVASGSDFVVTWDEGKADPGPEGVYWQEQASSGSPMDAREFGVKADGVTDDTAALQAAVDAMIADPLQGKRLMLPSGSIRLTSAIVIPTSQGWVIEGASRGSTRIVQSTSNTPTLRFTGNLTNNFRISDIYFEYASAQSSSNTSAVAILFDSGTDTTIYNFVIEHCSFNYCFRAVATAATGSTRLAVWGVTVRECDFFGDMSGAGLSLVPSTAIGQPNIVMDRCYFRCDNATEESVRITAGNVVTLRNVEFNVGDYGTKQQMSISSSQNVTLIGCRSEEFTYTTSGTKVLWDFPGSYVTAIDCHATVTSISAAGSLRFMQAASSGYLSIHGLYCNGTISGGGSLIPYAASTLGIVSGYVPAGSWLADPRTALGGTSAPKLTTYKAGDGVHIRGDVDVTLTTADLKYQYFNTTLTTNRTVNLPTTGLVDGYEFVIQRTGLGSFTLTVNDGSATNQDYTIASATKGFVHYRCLGTSGWIITAAGTLP